MVRFIRRIPVLNVDLYESNLPILGVSLNNTSFFSRHYTGGLELLTPYSRAMGRFHTLYGARYRLNATFAIVHGRIGPKKYHALWVV